MPTFQLCQCTSIPTGLSSPSADRHVRLRISLPLLVLVPFKQSLVRLHFGVGDAAAPTFSVTAQWANQLTREALRLSDLPLFLLLRSNEVQLWVSRRRPTNHSPAAGRKPQHRVCHFAFVSKVPQDFMTMSGFVTEEFQLNGA